MVAMAATEAILLPTEAPAVVVAVAAEGSF